MARAALGGISVVHRGDAPPAVWMPIKPAATIYVGSIVCIDQSALDEGVICRGIADGAADTSNKDRPFGVCVGTNLYNESYDSTYKTNKIVCAAAAGPHTNTTDYRNVEGPWSKGDSGSRAMVKVEMITPSTVLRAPIFNAAVGTAPTLLTVTTGSSDGLGVTTGACDFTPVANLSTVYYRKGANAGVYRITDDTSTTVLTHDVATPYDIAVGDTAVRVPLRHSGVSYVRIGDDTCASFIDCSQTPATNYDVIHVVRLDLSEAGSEFVDFMFDGDHFATARA